MSSLCEQSQIIPRKFTQSTHLFSTKDTPLPDDILVKVGSTLHITPRQVAIAFDIWKLGELEKSLRNTINGSGSIAKVNQAASDMEATYKSMMKRTLLKALRDNQDELNFDSMDVGDQKEHLETCFKGAIVRYRSILK